LTIRIVNYTASASPLVQAFVNVEIDGWLRLNGLNLYRDGTLRAAQLTPIRQGKRLYIDAIQVLDADLSKRLAADILAAIHAHIALLPVERRLRPPIAPKPPREPKSSAAAPAQKPSPSPAAIKPASTKSAPPKLKPLPPPQRLLLPRPQRPAIGK
jgi:hypothetical protein